MKDNNLNNTTKNELLKLISSFDKYSFSYDINWLKNNTKELKNEDFYEFFRNKINRTFKCTHGQNEGIQLYYTIEQKDSSIIDANSVYLYSPNSISFIIKKIFNTNSYNWIKFINTKRAKKINFYIFSNKEKIEEKKFGKVFKLFKDKLDTPYKEYNNKYRTFSKENFRYLLGQLSNNLWKYLPYVLILFFSYLVLYYQSLLNTIGFSDQLIFTDSLVTSIKVLEVAFLGIAVQVPVLYLLIIMFIAILVPIFDTLENNSSRYIIVRLLPVMFCYMVILTVVLKHNILHLNKNNINVSNPIIENYFL